MHINEKLEGMYREPADSSISAARHPWLQECCLASADSLPHYSLVSVDSPPLMESAVTVNGPLPRTIQRT